MGFKSQINYVSKDRLSLFVCAGSNRATQTDTGTSWWSTSEPIECQILVCRWIWWSIFLLISLFTSSLTSFVKKKIMVLSVNKSLSFWKLKLCIYLYYHKSNLYRWKKFINCIVNMPEEYKKFHDKMGLPLTWQLSQLGSMPQCGSSHVHQWAES